MLESDLQFHFRYYIVNFQKHRFTSTNTTYTYTKIGEWKSGELFMNDSDIFWRTGKVLKSVCSEECGLGYVKVSYWHPSNKNNNRNNGRNTHMKTTTTNH